MCCNPKFCRSPNLSFFRLGPWAIIHGIATSANTFISQIWFLMTPFELFFSKLLENPKKFDIESTELKLWQFERIANKQNVVEHLSTALTWVSLIQCQTFYDVLQSKILLEPYLSFSALDHAWYRHIGKHFYLSQILFLMMLFKLSFQKNLTLNPQNSSYGNWKNPQTIDGGGGVERYRHILTLRWAANANPLLADPLLSSTTTA